MIDQITDVDLDRLAKMLAARSDEEHDKLDTVLVPQDLDEARREGVQDALHILSSAMLLASTQLPVTDGEGRKAALDLHTLKAMSNILQKRTGVAYSGARKRG